MNPQVIFVSTACVKGQQPLIERINDYQAAGIEGIELGMNVAVEPGNIDQLATMEGNFLVHNYFPPPEKSFILNLASEDIGVRQQSIDLAKRALDLSQALGAPFYAIHAGFVSDPCGFGNPYFLFPEITDADARPKALARFLDALGIVHQYALEREVELLVENNVCAPEIFGQVLLDSTEEYPALFKAIDSQTFGLLVDFGHLNVAAHTLGFDRLDFIDQLAPYIRYFHVHDNDGTHDSHNPVEPGSWVLEVLRRPDFAAIPLVVESKFEDVFSLAKHVKWLQEELER